MSDPMDETAAAETVRVAPGSPPAGFEPPVIAGRYELLGLLGTGGMGNVYRARDKELDELVALKVLRPEIAGAVGSLERFRREVKLARRVTHPNVARVFDIGDEGGERYLTMELVDGEPLGAIIQREGRLRIGRAIEIAAAVCAGLDAAHAAGVVHCDLKPDNVLSTEDGRVVVTDFGLARAAAESGATSTGSIAGTPAYMAPEQVEGLSPDPRADIYALGAVLYEMLTGEPPWQGPNAFAVVSARLLRPPPDPREKRAEIPPELSALVLRCLARRPEDRVSTASELARDLAAAMPRARAAALPAPMPIAPGDDVLPPPSGRFRRQLAVLPFRNIGHGEQDYVADGLTEDLIDRLSAASGLSVRSRGTVMRYRGGDRDPREIGRELGVPVVVEGSIRREAGKVRIAVRLVGVTDGVQLWHTRFDRPEAEIFEVSEAAARAICEALSIRLPPRAHGESGSAEAIDLYLRARSFYLRFFSDQHGESARLYERALALAPEDSRILAGYAMATSRLWTGGPQHAERARRAAERAVEHAPNLAESHVALAMVLYQEGRAPETVVALKRALHVSRFNAEAHDMMGRILSETHLGDAARRHLETAMALEPDLELSRALLARMHMLRSDWDGAEALLDGAGPGRNARLPAMSRLCLWKRDEERARRMLAEDRPQTAASWPVHRTLLEAIAHRTPPFDRFPGQADVTPRFHTFLCQLEAECAMFLGDEERALEAVEKTDRSGAFDVAWADACPLFGPIRSHARFRAARDGIASRAERVVEAYLVKVA